MRGIDQALRLAGSSLPGRHIRDASLPDTSPGAPSFPDVDRLFFAQTFTGWNSPFSGVTHPYRQHVWVNACVNAIAQNISGIPLIYFTGTRKNKRLVESHPLIPVMESPNPMMSGSQLIEATYIYLGTTGEAFYILDRPDITAVPKEIWTFPPSRFQHVVNENSGSIIGWVYTQRN